MATRRPAINFKALLVFLLFAALAVAAVGASWQAEAVARPVQPEAVAPPPTVTTEPLPAGTEVQTVLTGMSQPVAMAFDPQGRLFYTERSGAVRLFANGALQSTPVITFPNIYNGTQCIESRLLGIAVDPQFSANHYLYAYYTQPLECNVAVNRVVRFVENGGVGGSATDVFTSTQTGPLHNGGIINFGPDGKLYITMGDDNNAATAQDVTVKPGKMHRINPDGTIPPDNPVFTQTGALPSIYAIGMRNPFGFAFDTVVSGRIFMSDNGPECDDELNRVEAGYNYGWRANYPCDDGNPDPTYNTVPPLWYVPQGQGAIAPTGVEVYGGSAIPAWQGHLFMCSFTERKLRHFYLNADRTQATTVGIVPGVECGMDLATGPDGALYYIDAGGYSNGNLKRIAPSPPQAVCGTMMGSIVPSPNVNDPVDSYFLAVSALSANDIWAVGLLNSNAGYRRSFAYHWNGVEWAETPLPDAEDSVLNDVLAISSDDAWAVGSTGNQTLTLHWDGSHWSRVASPNPASMPSSLVSLSARASNDVWAVGYTVRLSVTYPPATYTDGLIMRWNGTQWALTPSITSQGDDTVALRDVTAISANDAWAVGTQTCLIASPQEDKPLSCPDPGYSEAVALRWNGAQWNRVPASTTGYGQFQTLDAVDAISASDVWAVGGDETSGSLVLHWNGQAWSRVTGPDNGLSDVVAVSANNVWATGGNALVHWNGQAWSVVPSASLVRFSGLAVLASNDIVMAGYEFADNRTQGNIYRWDGSQISTVFQEPRTTAPPNDTLRSVSALTSEDVWAVGWRRSGTLIERWNGTYWSEVFSTSPVTSSFLYGVTAIASNDVWAAGYYNATFGGQRTLIEHWNGSYWQVVSSPNPSVGTNQIRAIDASSLQNVWAVGHHAEDTTVRPLILRWQGTQWDVVPAPDFGAGTEARLLSVEVLGDNNAWAVGNFKPTSSGNAQTLILHWDGSAWSRIPSPNADPATNNFLRGVTAVTGDDIWAVGYYGPSGTGQSLLLHWNGSAWSRVPSPNAGDGTFPVDIKAVSANDVWAVGNAFSGGVARTLVMHWDGAAWSVVSSPNASSGNNYLFGIAPVSASDVWIVGDYSNENGRMTLIERYRPQLFSDVPPSNTFYSYVQCLACRGVMGGYSDGTFRPNNNITRGQLSKIVANSAGFNEPVSGVMFEDVPPGNTFYEFIQRMAARGIIGGYPCGGPGEPCGPDSKPYFRPNANATRGQISKIVAQARGYTDPVSGQTFEDVPPTNGFYLYVERLATRGIMGGYPCGTIPTEPCGPQNRPYFRWGNNATRGQTSKIVSNTFFPNCDTASNP